MAEKGTGKIYAVCLTALGFCLYHHFNDKQLEMRPVYGWFAIVIVSVMAITALVSFLRRPRKTVAPAHNADAKPVVSVASRGPDAESPTDRAILREILVEIQDRGSAPITFKDVTEWDRKFRALFRCSPDPKVREDAFSMWESVQETWIQGLRKAGKVDLADEWEQLNTNFKAKHKKLDAFRQMVEDPDFQAILARAEKQ